MVRIIWTELATSDLNEIYGYISQDSKLYAKRQLLKIRNKTKILKTYKYSGNIVPEFELPIIRELL